MNRWMKCWMVAAACAATFLAGVALACDGNYGDPFDDSNCVALEQTIEDNCCIAVGGAQRRCATCTREVFMCDMQGEIVTLNGPAHNCHSVGAACQ
jgi:hypothetical protein